MKTILLLLTLFFGIHTAWGHDTEVDGIFYALQQYDLHYRALANTSHCCQFCIWSQFLKTVYVTSEEAKAFYEAENPWNAYEIVVTVNTGIENTEIGNNAAGISSYYDLNGIRITGKKSGSTIVRYSDGSTRKVIVR